MKIFLSITLFSIFLFGNSAFAQQERQLEELMGAYTSVTPGLNFTVEIRKTGTDYVLDICRNIEQDDCRTFPLDKDLLGDDIQVIKPAESQDINEAFFLRVITSGQEPVLSATYADGFTAELHR